MSAKVLNLSDYGPDHLVPPKDQREALTLQSMAKATAMLTNKTENLMNRVNWLEHENEWLWTEVHRYERLRKKKAKPRKTKKKTKRR